MTSSTADRHCSNGLHADIKNHEIYTQVNIAAQDDLSVYLLGSKTASVQNTYIDFCSCLSACAGWSGARPCQYFEYEDNSASQNHGPGAAGLCRLKAFGFGDKPDAIVKFSGGSQWFAGNIGGNDLASAAAPTREVCYGRCVAEKLCAASVYWHGMCYLKKSDPVSSSLTDLTQTVLLLSDSDEQAVLKLGPPSQVPTSDGTTSTSSTSPGLLSVSPSAAGSESTSTTDSTDSTAPTTTAFHGSSSGNGPANSNNGRPDRNGIPKAINGVTSATTSISGTEAASSSTGSTGTTGNAPSKLIIVAAGAAALLIVVLAAVFIMSWRYRAKTQPRRDEPILKDGAPMDGHSSDGGDSLAFFSIELQHYPEGPVVNLQQHPAALIPETSVVLERALSIATHSSYDSTNSDTFETDSPGNFPPSNPGKSPTRVDDSRRQSFLPGYSEELDLAAFGGDETGAMQQFQSSSIRLFSSLKSLKGGNSRGISHKEREGNAPYRSGLGTPAARPPVQQLAPWARANPLDENHGHGASTSATVRFEAPHFVPPRREQSFPDGRHW